MKKILVAMFVVAFGVMGLACGTEQDNANTDVYGVAADEEALGISYCRVINRITTGDCLSLDGCTLSPNLTCPVAARVISLKVSNCKPPFMYDAGRTCQ